MSADFELAALVPAAKTPAQNGVCEVWYASMRSGDSYVMVKAIEPTAEPAVLFLTPAAAVDFGRQLIDAGERLQNGTVTVTFSPPTESRRS